MSEPLRIGVAGLGVVGGGLIGLLQARKAAPGERPFVIQGVSARNRARAREADISGYRWVDDPVALASDRDVDVFVELMGGADGPAKAAVEAALKRGAHVVTANKALLATHGEALAALSEQTGGQILFEAAVGGGMPIVKAVRESLAGAHIKAISGILNGTCNYLLTEMEASGRSFSDVLKDAQRLGYAEADPTTDVGGFDAAHKITLLAAIAFGAKPDLSKVLIEGVEQVTLLDIRLAGKLGYRIKLIAKAERRDDGVHVHVAPALVAFLHPLANVGGSLNAALVEAEPVGQLTFIGRGAGAGPTAVAVMADLIDLANGARRPVFGKPLKALETMNASSAAEEGRFFLRLLVRDKPGVIAAVSDRLARAGVSIESFLQQPVNEDLVPIVLTTRRCRREALTQAVAAITQLAETAEPPRLLAIEEPSV